jgi:hypothetical protein|nr:MAG: hypothetical protein DIU62_12315 [Pseudomonadota bacterium]
MMKPSILALLAMATALPVTPAAAASADCDKSRVCLQRTLDTYLGALVARDPSRLPVTRNVKYTENGVRLNLGDGLWATASAMPTYRLDVIDEEEGQAGILGRINENGNNNWYAARLRVEPDGRVSELEVLVNRRVGGGPAGGAGGAPPREFTEPHPLMNQVLPQEQWLPRAELVRISNAYFTGIDTGTSSYGVSFSPQCQRRENGNIMASNPDATPGSIASMDCRTQFDTGFQVIVADIRERRFEVVDRTKGLAFGWGYFDHDGTPEKMSNTLERTPIDVQPMFRQPFSFYIAELFKIVDGQIRQIEAVLTTVPYGMESGW